MMKVIEMWSPQAEPGTSTPKLELKNFNGRRFRQYFKKEKSLACCTCFFMCFSFVGATITAYAGAHSESDEVNGAKSAIVATVLLTSGGCLGLCVISCLCFKAIKKGCTIEETPLL